jgi:twitching motility protein PilT
MVHNFITHSSSTAPAGRPGRIDSLEAIDIYIPISGNGVARYNLRSPKPGKPANLQVPEEYNDDLAAIRNMILNISKEDFSISYDGQRYRGSRQRLSNGEEWVCLRRISNELPSLEDINIDPRLIPYFRSLGKRNGLILICGGTGHGKSTTANVLLTDYLNRYGNVALTIEDPVEFSLAGERGPNGGYCFQVEVDDDEGWAPALKRALRWHPRYILVGEVRTPAAAAQLLRAATSGHLVICTMHAGSIQKGISALTQLAEAEVGSRAVHLVAESFSAILHQTLTKTGPDFNFLFFENTDGDPLRHCIRNQSLHMLDSFIEQQRIQLQNNIRIPIAPD